MASTHDKQDGYLAPDITDLPADEWIDVSGAREFIVHLKYNVSVTGAFNWVLYGSNFDDKSGEVRVSTPVAQTSDGGGLGVVTTGAYALYYRDLPKYVCFRLENVTGTGSVEAAFAWR